MIQIPVMYQTAGWLVPTIVFCVMGVTAGFSALYLSMAISQIPGNKHLRERIEFSNISKLIFPKWVYLLILAGLIFNFQINNIVSIVESGQAMDNTLVAAAGKTCALVIYDPPSSSDSGANGGNSTISIDVTTSTTLPYSAISHLASLPAHYWSVSQKALYGGNEGTDQGSIWRCITQNSGADSTFGDSYIISLGFLVVMGVTVPLGYMNLEDNIWVQVVGFLGLVACIITWTYQFVFVSGINYDLMPPFYLQGLGPVIPTVAFNWAFITTLPSWLNEKGKGVSVHRANWMAISIGLVMFLILGILGGLSIDFSSGEDLLAALNDPGTPNVMPVSKIMTFIFAPCSLLTGIPVYSIIIRYNLLENHIMTKFWANLFAVVLPWILALFVYPGNMLGPVISWSSAILFVGLNFILPIVIYIYLQSPKGQHHLITRMREEGVLEEAVINAEAEQLHEEEENENNTNRLLTHVSTRDLLAAKDSPPVGAWTRIVRFFIGSGDKSQSSKLEEKKQGLLSSEGKGAAIINTTVGRVQGVSFSASPMGTVGKGSFGLNSDPSDLLPSKCERLDELTADDFDWMGGDVVILPEYIQNCFGFKANERFGQFWLYFGLALGLVCLVLQVLSVSDPTDFAGA